MKNWFKRTSDKSQIEKETIGKEDAVTKKRPKASPEALSETKAQAPREVSDKANQPAIAAKGAAKRSAQVIDAIDDAPVGQMLSIDGGELPIATEWQARLGVMRSDNEVLLLATPEGYGSAQMFALRERMQNEGLRGRVVMVTGDVLALMYQTGAKQISAAMDNTAIEHLADEIIREAIHAGASDIHIEARGDYARVLFRINGQRHFIRDLTQLNALSLGSVLYNVYADPGSKDVTWSPDEIKDGGVERIDKTTGKRFQLRFSSGPIYPHPGFQIVMRILPMDAQNVMRLEDAGYTAAQLDLLEDMTSGATGMVIMCGPTNSGKSTALRAMIESLYRARGDAIKIITVEDPVEYIIPGACQVPIARRENRANQKGGPNQADAAFSAFLRGTLRQDPDVVMAGEIRDAESAKVVKDIVLAGRKLFTTLHTYSALWSFVRLRELGVPWELLTMPGYVSGVVYQRLVPTLCQHCSIGWNEGGCDQLPPRLIGRVEQVCQGEDISRVRIKGLGCSHCEHTGYSGRAVCAEIVVPDRTLLEFLSHGKTLQAERYWHSSQTGATPGVPGITALAHAIAKMRQGLVSPLDVEHYVSPLNADMDRELIHAQERTNAADHQDGLAKDLAVLTELDDTDDQHWL